MVPREPIDTADVPGGEPLRLFRRGEDYMIVLDRNELMNSRMSGSEEALAAMTCERLGPRKAPHLLIGGYGMGFILAELVPKIIDWARGPMAALTAGCLDDPRVGLIIGDVGDAIDAGRGAYDAILLDVDNGPDGLTRAGNDGLYSHHGLAAARAALKPGGILAIWSAAEDKVFARRLGSPGFAVEEVAVRARQNGKGPRHIIWFATKR